MQALPGPSPPVPATYTIRHQWLHGKRNTTSAMEQMSYHQVLCFPGRLPFSFPAFLWEPFSFCCFAPTYHAYQDLPFIWSINGQKPPFLSETRASLTDWTCGQPQTLSCFSLISWRTSPFPHLVLLLTTPQTPGNLLYWRWSFKGHQGPLSSQMAGAHFQSSSCPLCSILGGPFSLSSSGFLFSDTSLKLSSLVFSSSPRKTPILLSSGLKLKCLRAWALAMKCSI